MSIVVVTDGTRGADGALRLGLALSCRRKEPVQLLSTVDPTFVPGVTTRDTDAATRAAWLADAVSARRAEVLARVAAIGPTGERPDLVLRVEVGDPARVGAGPPVVRGGDLLVVGLGHHAPLDRWIGSETALRIMAHAAAPVLAVHPLASSLPARALVATDFGASSRAAALGALSLLPPGGALHLAHVLRAPRGRAGWHRRPADRERLRERARARLDRWVAEPASRARVDVHVHLLDGAPVEALRRLAASLSPELVAAGTRRHAAPGRRRLGRVARQLVRDACSCALVVPSAACGPDADTRVGARAAG